MEASKKAEGIDNFLTALTGINRVESIENDTCVFCNKPAGEFKDELSKREFAISGICQHCQDNMDWD